MIARLIREGHLELTASKQWHEEAKPTKAPWSRRFVLQSGSQASPDAAKSAKRPVEMQLAGRFSEDVGSLSALARLDLPATMGLSGYEAMETETVTIPGAYDALVRRYAYSEGSAKREGVWIVASQWPYPSTTVVSLSGQSVSDDLVHEVLAGLRFVKIEG